MKRIIILTLLFSSLISKGQIYQRISTWEEYLNRFRVTGMFRPPLNSVSGADKGSFYFRESDSTYLYWSGNAWRNIVGARQLNDSMLIVGRDTITIRGTGGGGGADSSVFATKYGVDTAKANIRDQIATKLPASDTVNKWVNDIRRSNDSVYAFKNGTWQFKYKDSVGTGGGSIVTPGIQTTVTGMSVNYDPRINSNLIFNDFLLTSIGPKWDASNAPNTTVTFASGHMRLVGGSSTDFIYDSTTTIVHRWTYETRAIIQSVGGSDYFSFGIQSQGIQTILFKIKNSDLSGTATYNNGGTTLGTTPAQGTTVIGDSVIYRIRRDNYTLYFDVINVTQSSSQTLTYNYSNIDGGATVIPFRAFSVTLNPVAGTIDIDYVKLYNQERLYADWLVIGHSIAEGFNAGHPDSTFYNRLQNYFPDKRFGLYAISGSKAADFNLPGSQKNDMLALRPRRALIVLGVNEIQAGTTTQTFVNNMRALVDTIENHGTQVIVCNTTPYNAANKAAIIAYNSALLTEFGTQLINIYDTLEVDGVMQSSNDSLHPDAQGHRYLFNVLKDEITRLANVPYDPEGLIRIFPRGIEAGYRIGTQSNLGYVPLNIGNSGTSGPGIGYNVKFQSTNNTYKYLNSDYANLIQLGLAGKMIFKVAPSGTAGDPITFTDAMTITPAGDIGNGEVTPLAPYHIKRNQSGKTTLGEASMLILDNTSGGTGQRQEIGMGYRNANAYSPVVLGNVVTSNTDFTISDFYIATRAATTNTTPIERFRIGADGRIQIHTADIGSASDSAWTWNRSTDRLEYSKINSGSFYTFSNGLTESGAVKLGGALTQATSITSTTSGHNLSITGISDYIDGPQLSVTNNGSAGVAIHGESTDGRGIEGFVTSGIGVYGNATNGTALFGNATTGSAISLQTTDPSLGNPMLSGLITGSDNNTVAAWGSFSRVTSGTASAGLGGSFDYYIQASNGTSMQAAQSILSSTDPTAATFTAKLAQYMTDGGVNYQTFTLNGKKVQLNQYGSGTNTVTPATTPVFNSSGEIGERIAPKIYTALLSQSGTAAPTAAVLGTNEIGSIVWTRNSTGSYTGTLSGAFTSNKTWLIVQKGDGNGSFVNALLSSTGANTVSLDVRDNAGSSTDNFTNMSIEIRVYP